MTETKLSITVEELALWLKDHGPLSGADEGFLTYGQARLIATRMLAAEALYDGATALLEVADATDCDEPMTEQFARKVGQHGERFRLNNLLGDAQDLARAALALADGREEKTQ